jgi:NTP pyrophosphatase (non-canonical NTP hydrolase)
MPILHANPTLTDIQTYVRQMTTERGFTDNPVTQECLLLAEEVGELCKAVRKAESLRTDANSKIGSLSEELADILIVTTAIANHYDIDLEQAFRDKEAVNHKRVWK